MVAVTQKKVVEGWDVEVGYRLPNNPEIAFFVRGFNWDYRDAVDNNGAEASLNWQASPHVNFEAWVSNELSATETKVNSILPETDQTFYGLRVKLTSSPVVFAKKNFKKNMITQMTQPVRRSYQVKLERSTGEFSNRATGS